MKDYYESVVRTNEEIRNNTKRLSNRAGYIKLILFVLFLAAIYHTVLNPGTVVYLAATILLFAIQAAAWIYHASLNEKIRHAEGLIAINQRQIKRISGEWSDFPDIGEEFLDPEHSYGADLDIIGKKSLFQFVNVTHTWYGRQALAEDLLNSDYTNHQIEARQQAIMELSKEPQLMGELEYRFSQAGLLADLPKLVTAFQENRAFIASPILNLLLTYLPFLTVITGGIALLFRRQFFLKPALILLFVQIILWLAGSVLTSNYLRGITRLSAKFGAYHDVIEMVMTAKFASGELTQIQAALGKTELSAVQAFKQLSGIAEKVQMRSNVFLYFSLNPLLLWDYECAIQYSAWKQAYGSSCEAWFQALGKLESMMSFAVLKQVCSHTCFPQFTDDRTVEASAIGHPLIKNEQRITNDLHLKDHILVISGSNMSGKTTYLRTAGINLVLARAGAPVCAETMRCSALKLVTSMRIADDLNEGISTFYAELKRIKLILDSAKNDRNTLFLIDEIFRGTNSVDRLAGARTVIKKLSQLGIMGMITTHDLELCELPREIGNVRNYSFSEHYQDGKILFDYKMRLGKSKTTNAKFLMTMVGILD